MFACIRNPKSKCLGRRYPDQRDSQKRGYDWITYVQAYNYVTNISSVLSTFHLLSKVETETFAGANISVNIMGQYLQNNPESVFMRYAVWSSGGTLVTLYPNLSNYDILHIIETTRLESIITDSTHATRLLDLMTSHPSHMQSVHRLIIVDEMDVVTSIVAESLGVEIVSFSDLMNAVSITHALSEETLFTYVICMYCM